jgi:1-acyl-sn-glycerol-3-phosphate acyltransferase
MSRPRRPAWFASPFALYEGDPYDPNPEKTAADLILTFKPPTPKRSLQRLALTVNRVLVLPALKHVDVVLPRSEADKLRAIPGHAGNLLVAPHPDWLDGQVMLHLYSVAGKVPAGFFMASDALQKRSALYRAVLSLLGAVPIRRGKPNPEAVEYLIQRVAEGGWGGIFPEGAIYISRRVMPMEYGAVRIGIEAALKAQSVAAGQSAIRPVFITPYAHVYFHTDREAMLGKMNTTLQEIEARPDVFGRPGAGDLPDRLRAVAQRILESKARRYHIAVDGWEALDLFERGERLQGQLLEQLERKYSGEIKTGYPRRRAMKVRMKIYERLAESSPTQKAELSEDLQKTLDIVVLISFDRAYISRYHDLEMWGEFLRRFRDSVGMREEPFGRRRAVVRVLKSWDVHDAAREYAALPTEESRREFLFRRTEDLRTQIQEGVDEICRENPPLRLA